MHLDHKNYGSKEYYDTLPKEPAEQPIRTIFTPEEFTRLPGSNKLPAGFGIPPAEGEDTYYVICEHQYYGNTYPVPIERDHSVVGPLTEHDAHAYADSCAYPIDIVGIDIVKVIPAKGE